MSSSDLQGIRYGTLMTEHFGIDSDMDRDSTEKLARVRTLWQKHPRTPEDEDELTRLRAILGKRSATLALELWNLQEERDASNEDAP